jgi:hypothetical protein
MKGHGRQPTLELTPSNTALRYAFFTTTTPPTTRTPDHNTPKAPFIQRARVTDHPSDLACNWAGIGGTVVDVNGSQVVGTVVVLAARWWNTVEQQTVTGINKEYGQSGFEFVLGNAPVASKGTLYVQLVDLQNIPMSDKIS